ncbi:MAG: c-type cytochrome [Candidatus Kryptoniota bacterium]
MKSLAVYPHQTRHRFFLISKKKENVDNGIGPIKELKLSPKIDKNLVEEGSSIFYSKCYLCHDVDQTKLAPPLRGVAKKLTPVFIMNYLLNTAEMQEKDPIIKNLLKEYSNVPKMPNQQLTRQQARAVLEFLRTIE